MASSVWCFLVPLVLVLCTTCAMYTPPSDSWGADWGKQEFPELVKQESSELVQESSELVQQESSELVQQESTELEQESAEKVICPRREVYSECEARCQRDCTTINENPALCTEDCTPGCICERGLVRDSEGHCISPSKCPGNHEDGRSEEHESEENEDSEDDWEEELENKNYCPLGEEFISCEALCEFNCGNQNGSNPLCNKPGVCVSGCRCASGYVRGPEGTCIKPEECPTDDHTKYPVKRVCPRKEIWVDYIAHCQGNCSTGGRRIPCPRIGVEGCICKKGLYRRDDGVCVPLNKCPKEDGNPGKSFCLEDEMFITCFSHCEPDCEKKNGRFDTCRNTCVSGCRCNFGYVRGPRGKCIKPEKCPAKDDAKYPVKRVCPPKEHWETSKAHCQVNCTNMGKPLECPSVKIAGCVCDKNLYRGRDGKCIPKQQCPKRAVNAEDEMLDEDEIVDEDEIYDQEDEAKEKSFCPQYESFIPCKAHCERNCTSRNSTFVPCRNYCVSGCTCIQGYVRGPKGACIKADKCPAKDNSKFPIKRICPKDEVWETSTAHCQKNCTNVSKKIPCLQIKVAGCVCKKNLLRGKDGKCIPKNKCPKNGDEENSKEQNSSLEYENPEDDKDSSCPTNESFVKCYSHCEKHCGNRHASVVPCQRVCVSGCRCDEGFVRGPWGTCIKPEQCPAKDEKNYPVRRICAIREHWETSRAHCQVNCSNFGKPLECPEVVVPGCVCNNDLYRGEDGKCIPKTQCPKKADKSTEGEKQLLNEEDSSTENENAEQVSSGNCPNVRKCIAFCRQHGSKHGRCVGRHRARCFCR